MCAIPRNEDATAEREASEPQSFWRRLAAAIDSFAAYPVRHALSERNLSHVEAEIERCRQLISGRRSRPRGTPAVRFPILSPQVLLPSRVLLPSQVLAPIKVRS